MSKRKRFQMHNKNRNNRNKKNRNRKNSTSKNRWQLNNFQNGAEDKDIVQFVKEPDPGIETGPEDLADKEICKIKYKPEYCEELIRHRAEGGSIISFAEKIHVGDRTIRNWTKDHPEFKKAMVTAWEKFRIYEKAHSNVESSRPSGGKTRACKFNICRNLNSDPTLYSETAVSDESSLSIQSKYNPEFCWQLIKNAAEGRNIVQFADKINITPSTLYVWAMKYPEFKEALELSKVKLESFYWNALEEEMKVKFDFKIWQFIMINNFGYKKINSASEPEEEDVQHVIILPEIKHREVIKETSLPSGSNNESEYKTSNAETYMDTAEYTEYGSGI